MYTQLQCSSSVSAVATPARGLRCADSVPCRIELIPMKQLPRLSTTMVRVSDELSENVNCT
jgi:hypothetical protein